MVIREIVVIIPEKRVILQDQDIILLMTQKYPNVRENADLGAQLLSLSLTIPIEIIGIWKCRGTIIGKVKI